MSRMQHVSLASPILPTPYQKAKQQVQGILTALPVDFQNSIYITLWHCKVLRLQKLKFLSLIPYISGITEQAVQSNPCSLMKQRAESVMIGKSISTT